MVQPHPTPRMGQVPSGLRSAMDWLLLLLVVFCPLAFGGVHAWAEMVVLSVVAVVVFLFALHVFWNTDRWVWTWAYVPVFFFVELVFIQCVPLPVAWVAWISPETVAAKNQMLEQGAGAWTTLSLYPHGTWHDLRLVVACSVLFVVVIHVYREPWRITRLLKAIAVTGCGVGALGLVQKFFGNGHIYGWVPTQGAGTSGPFVNPNNYGQFLLLSLGASFAVLFLTLQEGLLSQVRHPVKRLEQVPEQVRQRLVLWAAVALGQSVALLVSGSRGAVVAALAAGVVMTGLMVARDRQRPWATWAVTFGLFVVCGLLLFGFEQVYAGFAAFGTPSDLSVQGRWAVLGDLVHLALVYPVVGIGQGAFAMVYPSVQSLEVTHQFLHADSDWFQLMAEVGAVGLALVLGFVLIMAHVFLQGIRSRTNAMSMVSVGLGFALLGVMLHSMVDFGQHLPANALLSVIYFGLLICLTRLDSPTPEPPVAATSARSIQWPVGQAVAVFMVVMVGWMTASSVKAAVAEHHVQSVEPVAERVQKGTGTLADLDRLIVAHDQARAWVPGDVQVAYRLNLYRWQRLLMAQGSEASKQAQAQKIVNDLVMLQHRAALFTPTLALCGQAAFASGSPEQGLGFVRRAAQATPRHAHVCFVAGMMEAEGGEADQAVHWMQQAVSVDGTYFPRAMAYFLHRMGWPDAALTLAGDDERWLLQVVHALQETPWGDVADQARRRATDLLLARRERGEATADHLVQIAQLKIKDKDWNGAAGFYRQALHRAYDRVDWRLAQAKVLAEADRVDEAMRALQICLRVKPDYEPARVYLAQLRTQGP